MTLSGADKSFGLKGAKFGKGSGGGGVWGLPGPGRSPRLGNKVGGGFAGKLLQISDFRALIVYFRVKFTFLSR